jgi:hypothetical protein
MTSLDELDLPTAMIQAIKDAGLKSVEELCAKRMIEVAKMVDRVAENGIQGIKDVRAALGKLGLDLQSEFDDPVGWPMFPSHRILRNLLYSLNLTPRTIKVFKRYMLGVYSREELLTGIDPDDYEKITRLLELMDGDDDNQCP